MDEYTLLCLTYPSFSRMVDRESYYRNRSPNPSVAIQLWLDSLEDQGENDEQSDPLQEVEVIEVSSDDEEVQTHHEINFIDLVSDQDDGEEELPYSQALMARVEGDPMDTSMEDVQEEGGATNSMIYGELAPIVEEGWNLANGVQNATLEPLPSIFQEEEPIMPMDDHWINDTMNLFKEIEHIPNMAWEQSQEQQDEDRLWNQTMNNLYIAYGGNVPYCLTFEEHEEMEEILSFLAFEEQEPIYDEDWNAMEERELEPELREVRESIEVYEPMEIQEPMVNVRIESPWMDYDQEESSDDDFQLLDYGSADYDQIEVIMAELMELMLNHHRMQPTPERTSQEFFDHLFQHEPMQEDQGGAVGDYIEPVVDGTWTDDDFRVVKTSSYGDHFLGVEVISENTTTCCGCELFGVTTNQPTNGEAIELEPRMVVEEHDEMNHYCSSMERKVTSNEHNYGACLASEHRGVNQFVKVEAEKGASEHNTSLGNTRIKEIKPKVEPWVSTHTNSLVLRTKLFQEEEYEQWPTMVHGFVLRMGQDRTRRARPSLTSVRRRASKLGEWAWCTLLTYGLILVPNILSKLRHLMEGFGGLSSPKLLRLSYKPSKEWCNKWLVLQVTTKGLSTSYIAEGLEGSWRGVLMANGVLTLYGNARNTSQGVQVQVQESSPRR